MKAKARRPIGSLRPGSGCNDGNSMPRVQRDRLSVLAKGDVTALIAAHQKYGDSWRRKGGAGAYFTISRKVDRYERACEAAGYDVFKAIRTTVAGDGTVDGKDGLLDDIRDLRRYLLLVEEYIQRGAA